MWLDDLIHGAYESYAYVDDGCESRLDVSGEDILKTPAV